MATLNGANDVSPEPTPAVTSNYKYNPYDPNKPPETVSLDGTQYQIGSFAYPVDIMSKQYGGNFAMFFINVQSESKLNKELIASGGSGFATDLLTGKATATGLSAVTNKAIGIGAVVAGQAIIGATQGAIVRNAFDSIGKEIGNLGAAVIGAGIRSLAVGAIAYEAGGFNQPVKRLKTAIALHMPIAFSVKYTVNYEEADVGLGYRGAQALGNNITSLSGIGSAALEGGSAAAMSAAGDASGMISKLTKNAVNPVKEQVFKSVDFRTFTFNYTFAPRSSTESQNCLNIIQQFKFHMHPEFKSEDQFLYIYPSEFDISYYNNNKQNDKIHHHTSCVLTDLALDYAPQGTYSTFADGTPTQINMTLTFRELGKLNKENIQKEKF